MDNTAQNQFQHRSNSQPPQGYAHGPQGGPPHPMYTHRTPRGSSLQPPKFEDGQSTFFEPPPTTGQTQPQGPMGPPPGYFQHGAYQPQQHQMHYPAPNVGIPPAAFYGQTPTYQVPQSNRFFQGLPGNQEPMQDYIVYCQPVPALFPERQQISLGRINQAEFETMCQLFAVNNQVQRAIESHYRQLQSQPDVAGRYRGKPQDPFEQAFNNAGGGHPPPTTGPMADLDHPMQSIYPFQNQNEFQATNEVGAFQHNQQRVNSRISQRPNFGQANQPSAPFYPPNMSDAQIQMMNGGLHPNHPQFNGHPQYQQEFGPGSGAQHPGHGLGNGGGTANFGGAGQAQAQAVRQQQMAADGVVGARSNSPPAPHQKHAKRGPHPANCDNQGVMSDEGDLADLEQHEGAQGHGRLQQNSYNTIRKWHQEADKDNAETENGAKSMDRPNHCCRFQTNCGCREGNNGVGQQQQYAGFDQQHISQRLAAGEQDHQMHSFHAPNHPDQHQQLPVSYSNNHPNSIIQQQKQAGQKEQAQIESSSGRPLQGILKNNRQSGHSQNTSSAPQQWPGNKTKIPNQLQLGTDCISRLRYIDTLNLIQIYNKRSRVSNFVPGIRPKPEDSEISSFSEQDYDDISEEEGYHYASQLQKQQLEKKETPPQQLKSNQKAKQLVDQSVSSPRPTKQHQEAARKNDRVLKQQQMMANKKKDEPVILEINKPKPPQKQEFLNQQLMFGDIQMSKDRRPIPEESEDLSQSPVVAPHEQQHQLAHINELNLPENVLQPHQQQLQEQDYTHTSSESISEQLEGDIQMKSSKKQGLFKGQGKGNGDQNDPTRPHELDGNLGPQFVVQQLKLSKLKAHQTSQNPFAITSDGKMFNSGQIQPSSLVDDGNLQVQQAITSNDYFNAVNKDVEECKEEDVYDQVAKATISGQLPINGTVGAEAKTDSKNASGVQSKRSVISLKKKPVNASNQGQDQTQDQKNGSEEKPEPLQPQNVMIQRMDPTSKVVQITYDETRTRQYSKMENQKLSRQERLQKRQVLKEQHYIETMQAHLLNNNNEEDEEQTGLEDEDGEEIVGRENRQQTPFFTNNQNKDSNQRAANTQNDNKTQNDKSTGKKRELGQRKVVEEDASDQNLVPPASSSGQSRTNTRNQRNRKRLRKQKAVVDSESVNDCQSMKESEKVFQGLKAYEKVLRRSSLKKQKVTETKPKQPTKINQIQEEEKCAVEERGSGVKEAGEQLNLEQYHVGKLFEIDRKNLENELEIRSPEVKVEENESIGEQKDNSDKELDLIHAEFEKEFWRTPDNHKKQPTYLVFHRFMYQRMKNQCPDLQCYQLSLMVSNQWDKLSINQKEIWRKKHLELLKQVNDYQLKVQSEAKAKGLAAAEDEARRQAAAKSVKVTRICQEVEEGQQVGYTEGQEDQNKSTPREKQPSQRQQSSHSAKRAPEKSEHEGQSRKTAHVESNEDRINSEKRQKQSDGDVQRMEIEVVDEDKTSEKKQEQAHQGSENEQQLMEGEVTQIPSNKGGNQTQKDNLTDDNHMLDDDDWYTNMMKQIRDDAEAQQNEMIHLNGIINRPQEMYPDLEVEEIFRTFKVTTREPLLLLDHYRQSQSLFLWNKPLYCVYRQFKYHDNADKLYENQVAFEDLKAVNPRLTWAQFEKKHHPWQIRKTAPEHGHWRIFARGDHNAERPHLIELNDEYFKLWPEQNEIE